LNNKRSYIGYFGTENRPPACG